MQISHLYGRPVFFVTLCDDNGVPHIQEGVETYSVSTGERGIQMYEEEEGSYLEVRGEVADVIYKGRVVEDDEFDLAIEAVSSQAPSYDFALVYLDTNKIRLSTMRPAPFEDRTLLYAGGLDARIGWTFLALAPECPIRILDAEGRVTHVLEYRRGDVRCLLYRHWRADDMDRNPEFYLGEKWSDHCRQEKEPPSAVLRHVPADWLGSWVTVVNRDGSRVTGELTGASPVGAFIKEHPWKPDVTACDDVLWVSREDDGPAHWNAARQKALFRATETAPLFLSSHDFAREAEVSDVLAPVTVRAIGTCAETGVPIMVYGSGCLEKPGSYLVTSRWFDSYEDAKTAFWELTAAIARVYETREMVKRLWEFHCSNRC